MTQTHHTIRRSLPLACALALATAGHGYAQDTAQAVQTATSTSAVVKTTQGAGAGTGQTGIALPGQRVKVPAAGQPIALQPKTGTSAPKPPTSVALAPKAGDVKTPVNAVNVAPLSVTRPASLAEPKAPVTLDPGKPAVAKHTLDIPVVAPRISLPKTSVVTDTTNSMVPKRVVQRPPAGVTVGSSTVLATSPATVGVVIPEPTAVATATDLAVSEPKPSRAAVDLLPGTTAAVTQDLVVPSRDSAPLVQSPLPSATDTRHAAEALASSEATQVDPSHVNLADTEATLRANAQATTQYQSDRLVAAIAARRQRKAAMLNAPPGDDAGANAGNNGGNGGEATPAPKAAQDRQKAIDQAELAVKAAAAALKRLQEQQHATETTRDVAGAHFEDAWGKEEFWNDLLKHWDPLKAPDANQNGVSTRKMTLGEVTRARDAATAAKERARQEVFVALLDLFNLRPQVDAAQKALDAAQQRLRDAQAAPVANGAEPAAGDADAAPRDAAAPGKANDRDGASDTSAGNHDASKPDGDTSDGDFYKKFDRDLPEPPDDDQPLPADPDLDAFNKTLEPNDQPADADPTAPEATDADPGQPTSGTGVSSTSKQAAQPSMPPHTEPTYPSPHDEPVFEDGKWFFHHEDGSLSIDYGNGHTSWHSQDGRRRIEETPEREYTRSPNAEVIKDKTTGTTTVRYNSGKGGFRLGPDGKVTLLPAGSYPTDMVPPGSARPAPGSRIAER